MVHACPVCKVGVHACPVCKVGWVIPLIKSEDDKTRATHYCGDCLAAFVMMYKCPDCGCEVMDDWVCCPHCKTRYILGLRREEVLVHLPEESGIQKPKA